MDKGATMLPANIKSPIESMKIMRSSHSVSFKIIFIHLDDYNIYSHSILLDSQSILISIKFIREIQSKIQK